MTFPSDKGRTKTRVIRLFLFGSLVTTGFVCQKKGFDQQMYANDTFTKRAVALSKTLSSLFPVWLQLWINTPRDHYSVPRTRRRGPFYTPCSFIRIDIWAFHRSRRLGRGVGCHGAERQCVMCDDSTTSATLCGNDIWPVKLSEMAVINAIRGKTPSSLSHPEAERLIDLSAGRQFVTRVENQSMISFLCEIWLKV